MELKQYLSEIGAAGGQSTSTAKVRASRRNAKFARSRKQIIRAKRLAGRGTK